MTPIINESLKQAILDKYEQTMLASKAIHQEVEEYLLALNETEKDCIRFVYAFMHPTDLITYEVSEIASYVKSTLKMYDHISYASQVPIELFLSYVLSLRVNNENLDGSRDWMYEEIAPRVQGKSMTEAALEVNYWCYEKATYIPTDGRTIAPYGMCKRAQGRCGEESTLAVSALRSVGIPARQCYVPRWAHCDDNHAWVEVWTDGAWHYMGACEPEPVLDKGWFTAAASKAMLVHAKAYSHFLNGEKIASETPITSLINSTETYGNCVTMHVTVTENGVPKSNVPVSFQLINYSELFELYKENTNEEGKASFLTGNGDLYVCACADGRFIGKKVDLRKGTDLVLELSEGFKPEELTGDYIENFELNPPIESLAKAESADTLAEHKKRLRNCEEIRAAYESTFRSDSGISEKWDNYYKNAKGNYAELDAFCASEQFTREEKELLLDCLREKDLVDTTAEILAAYLSCALPYRGTCSDENWQNYILAARIEDEMLTKDRSDVKKYFENKETIPATGKEVWALVQSLQIIEDYHVNNCIASAARCLKYGIVTKSSENVVFVQICRALGILSRLNPVTFEPEYGTEENGSMLWYSVKSQEACTEETVTLTLKNTGNAPLEYMHHFTIGVRENQEWKTLNYWGTTLEKELKLEVKKGVYRLITTVRQIDGSVSAYVHSFPVNGDQEVKVLLREDETQSRLKFVPVPDGKMTGIDPAARTLEKNKESLYYFCEDKKTIFILCEPGKEPTEHLFQEILECQNTYVKEKYRVILALTDLEGLKNETYQRLVATEIDTVTVLCDDPGYIYQLHEVFHVGDERLPFAAAITPEHKGLFAFANYNIRTAWTLDKLFQCQR